MTTTAATISETLKIETAHHHEAIENAKRFTRLGSDDFSKDEYIQLLEKFYGFYRPLEKAFRQHPDVMQALDFDRRFKLPLLEEDLRFFGRDDAALAALPDCQTLPPTSTPAELIGCIYVMEGSTHGAQFISRRLRLQFQLDGEGVRFYEGYGKDTHPQWAAFKSYLDSHFANDAEGQAVVNSASATFQALHQWMDH
jgi:heme oxygenase